MIKKYEPKRKYNFLEDTTFKKGVELKLQG